MSFTDDAFSTAKNGDRHCKNPEKVTWEEVMGDVWSNPDEDDTVSARSFTSNAVCGGQMNDWTRYMQYISNTLEKQMGPQCSSMSIYGVALGLPYLQLISRGRLEKKKNKKKHPNKEDPCFFYFVLADELKEVLLLQHENHRPSKKDLAVLDNPNALTLQYKSGDGNGILVPIHASRLPYQNMRRNTKLFKLNGHNMFGWTDRLIWQDAKVYKRHEVCPTDYYKYFAETIDHNKVCSSFIGLPFHESTMGSAFHNNTEVQFDAHCAAIEEAAAHRPDVSDSFQAIHEQCQVYRSENDQTLSRYLVDSFFIVWDLRSKRCNQFIADMTCTWLDELHCYSDRDQLSLPQVFSKMALKEAGSGDEIKLANPTTDHRILVQEGDNSWGVEEQPFVHITKSSCHWYFNARGMCSCNLLENGDETPWGDVEQKQLDKKAPPKKLRLAVVVAGSFQRYFLQSTVERLIQPMVQKGHVVDYFLTLTTSNPPAFRSKNRYMQKMLFDPVFGEANNLTGIPPVQHIQHVVEEQVAHAGGRVRHIRLREEVDILGNNHLQKRTRQLLKENPKENPVALFPAMDLRSRAKKKAITHGNMNMLRLFLSVQQLWKRLNEAETDDNEKYDYVLFLRDDTFWLQTFDIDRLLRTAGSADLYVPSCDARDPALSPRELCDHIAIVARKKAAIFGNYFDELFDADLKSCAKAMPRKLKSYGKRGCNSEMILKWITQQHRLRTRKVPQDLIPFERSAHVQRPDGKILRCFHKFCQSKQDPLFVGQMRKCTELFS